MKQATTMSSLSATRTTAQRLNHKLPAVLSDSLSYGFHPWPLQNGGLQSFICAPGARVIVLQFPFCQSQCCTVLLFAITFCGFGVPTTSLGSRAIVLLSTTCGRGLSDTLARSSGLVDGSLGAAPGEVSGSQRRHGTHEHNPESRGRRSPLRAPASLA